MKYFFPLIVLFFSGCVQHTYISEPYYINDSSYKLREYNSYPRREIYVERNYYVPYTKPNYERYQHREHHHEQYKRDYYGRDYRYYR